MGDYREMREIDDCPGHAGRASENGQHKEPREEEDQYIRGPNTRVREPLRIPVQIRRLLRRHVVTRHLI